MPIMDGVDATRKIRELEGNTHHTPIIGLTAIDVENKKDKYKKAGLDDVLEKPIAVDELLHEIAYRVHAKDLQSHKHPSNIQNSTNTNKRLGLDTKLSSTMYEMLLEELPATKLTLISLYFEKDWDALRNEVHRFLGGISYCNVPHLQNLTITFQKSLKSRDSQLENNFEALISEIETFISANHNN